MKGLLLASLVFFINGSTAFALGDRVGENTAQFLRVGAGARALAMGDAYTAVAEGPETVYWNPAGLTTLRRASVHYSRTEMLEFFHHDFAAFGVPVGRGAIGVGLTRWSQDSLPLTNTANVVVGKFAPHSEAISIAYAHRFSAEDPEEADRGYFRDAWMTPGGHRPLRHESDPWQGALAMGVAAKFIRETIYSFSAEALALDAGLTYRPLEMEQWNVAAAVRNLGSRERFVNAAEPLPAELSIGTSYDYRYGDRQRLLPVLEAVVPMHARAHAKVGVEWTVPAADRITVAFRAGYKTQAVSDVGALAGVTGGVGFNFHRASIDLAFQPMAELGEVYRISLGWRF